MPAIRLLRAVRFHRFRTCAQRFLFAGLSLGFGCGIHAAEFAYPFETKSDSGTILEVHSARKSKVPAAMFSLNCGWPGGKYGKSGYHNPAAQEAIRMVRPAARRRPHGVLASFHDWESDGRRMTDSDQTPYDSAVKDHLDDAVSMHKDIGHPATTEIAHATLDVRRIMIATST